MINKIIDGVDVSGCEHFCRADCCSAFYLENADDYCPCEGQECNYKRLIRLKQENERLKETNLQLQTIDMEIDRNNKYRKALEEIRGILCKGRTFYDGYFENENLSRTDKAIKVINEVLG